MPVVLPVASDGPVSKAVDMTTADDARRTDRSRREDLSRGLDEQQRLGLGDMDPGRFREAGHAVVDMMADYLERLSEYAVLPDVQPGFLRGSLPATPPE